MPPPKLHLNEHLSPRLAVQLRQYGFDVTSTVSGSHHIFTHPQIRELVNLQNVYGQAKPYQIRQFMDLIERYNLNLED